MKIVKRFALLLAAIAALSTLGGLGCSDDKDAADKKAAPAAAPTDATTDSATDSSSDPSIDPSIDAVDDDKAEASVQASYPTQVTPDPLAQKLCEAAQQTPRVRRAACCDSKPGLLLTSECVRMLSAANEAGAVKLVAAAVEGCAQAVNAAHEGCEWVGAWSVRVPDACSAVVEGTLAAGKRCRSSMECATGLACAGVSPTDRGTCEAPASAGASCGRGVDPLASYLMQGAGGAHDECEGFCANGRCRAHAAVGKPCVSNEHCGPDAHCDAKKVCTAGAEGALGEACRGGECGDEARCVQGQCVAPKAAGESCAFDAECRAACVDSKCAMRCDR